jgi:hypothetical protein
MERKKRTTDDVIQTPIVNVIFVCEVPKPKLFLSEFPAIPLFLAVLIPVEFYRASVARKIAGPKICAKHSDHSRIPNPSLLLEGNVRTAASGVCILAV